MSRSACFVTGTDTGVGKTLVAAGLLQQAAQRGLRTAALKPVAAGAQLVHGKLVNEDGVLLQRTSNSDQSYDEVNPVTLAAAIAPHIAAQQESSALSVEQLLRPCRTVMEREDVDFLVVEGAGGWLVPLNDQETLADLASALELPVVLVVGMKLGCLNHALLTCQAIDAAGLELAGWVASCIDPQMLALQENLDSLGERISAPCLGVIDYLTDPTPENAARRLRAQSLLP
jgi:dethiobiotin synthetase